jgi:hypothetical protein
MLSLFLAAIEGDRSRKTGNTPAVGEKKPLPAE